MKSIGISFLNLLTLLFILLKVFGVINWSWLIVLLPTLISFGLGLLFLIIFALIALIAFGLDD